ncbi:lytic murein transglycosylase [Caulobacter sp. KR2-114]|uniref:lytic murein transglycosylase n=1 Tax=Caulobacter sp. KR2-114 TaxID=3400912 RepID=UPI003C0C5C1B
MSAYPFARRTLIGLALAGAALPIAASAQGPKPADLLGATGEAYFTDWLNDYYARALAGGTPKAVLDRELSGISPDPRVGLHDAGQPEFARPVSAYIQGVVSADRIAIGQKKRVSITQFPAIEARYGVPREILIGIWAMESGFGAQQGDMDIIRCLATLAALGRRRAWAEGELTAALKIIASGEASRAQLKGSWAGAMGQTQFIPSAFLSTAVDGDGDGKRDIWNSAPDALASAANLLDKGGWRRGEAWAREVILPRTFDYGLAEGPKELPGWWESKGARRADGQAWNKADADAPAQLLLPCGLNGPAFLIFQNHLAIRTYNNSVAYALGVGLLADRMAGGGPLKTPWPKETPLSLTDRMDAQTALQKLGFNPGQPDGVIGLGTRQSLRAWQKAKGLPADGYLSPDMIARLKAEVAGK